MLIRSINQYFGPNGERIEVMNMLDARTMETPTEAVLKELNTDDEPITVYLGILLIPVGVSDQQGNVIDVRPQEIRFPIEANSIAEAFSQFAANAEAVVKDLKKKQSEKQSNLVVPNPAESEAINNMKLFVPE